jgi:hypothetical protein
MHVWQAVMVIGGLAWTGALFAGIVYGLAEMLKRAAADAGVLALAAHEWQASRPPRSLPKGLPESTAGLLAELKDTGIHLPHLRRASDVARRTCKILAGCGTGAAFLFAIVSRWNV